MPETDQAFPSRNTFDKVQQNEDGSIDLYFGPTEPQGVNEKNWIQTLKGRVDERAAEVRAIMVG